MKRVTLSIVVAAGAIAVSAGLVSANDEKSEPFYRKYLAPGSELDDRIIDQERRVEAEPDSADLRNDFGNLLAARRFSEDARMQYEKALELDKSHYLAAYNLGLLWETEGKPWRAIWAYRKSIKRKPGFPLSHFRLGRLYERRGWEKLAVKEYAKALRLDPQMRDPRVNPLVVDVRLLDRVSLENYPRDLAAASMESAHDYADRLRFRKVPADRPVASDEVGDAPAPEPVDATVTAPRGARAPVSLPPRPGETRPQQSQPLPPGTLPPGTPPLPPATPVP